MEVAEISLWNLDLRRSEQILNLAGLTRQAGDTVDEFVVHVRNGYDWRINTKR